MREFLWGRWEAEARFAESAVYAENYFGTPREWRSVRGGLPTNLRDTEMALDKQLAHITLERADPTSFVQFADRVDGLEAEIGAQWVRFLDQLSSSPWHSRFTEAVTATRVQLGLP